MSILLLRAIHLQVFTKSQWVNAAEDFKKKAQYNETTRGRILDFKGHELAVDEACMDACVDYRAIVRDPEWIRRLALSRASGNTDSWAHADKARRKVLVDEAAAAVKHDIDQMFVL